MIHCNNKKRNKMATVIMTEGQPSDANKMERQIISISRELLNENDFENRFHPVSRPFKSNWYKKLYPPEPILAAIKPPMSQNGWKLFIFTHIPILNWIWNYQSNYFFGDIISGLTIGIMTIPQSLAYAQLAGVPPVYGLYASFIPPIVYSIFGSSRHASMGTFAVVSLMVFNAINRVIEGDPSLQPCLNNNVSEFEVLDFNTTNISCEEIKVEIAISLAFLSGIIMVVLGAFQLGVITILLSESLISGYTTGAAVHVLTSQLKHIIGVKVSIRGVWSIPRIWYSVLYQLFTGWNSVNTATVIISALSLSSLVIFRIIDRKLLRKLKVYCCFFSRKDKNCIKQKFKWPIPLPAPLIVVIVAAGISYGIGLHDKFDVAIVENVPKGLPAFTVPNWSWFFILLQDAFVISIVTFSISVSVSQVFAKQLNYTISSTQELIAYGVTNIIGSLFSSFSTSASLSRTTVQATSGGYTQVVGFISSILILIVLLFLGPLFEPLPNAVLASIIWISLYGLFIQVLDLKKYLKLSIPDMVIWIVVFIATVLLGVDLGLAVGVVFSLCVILFKIILPKSSILGRATNTEIYRDIENFELVKSVPGVIIYRFLAPLCFLNCKLFMAHLELLCNIKKSKEIEGIIPSFINKCKNKKDIKVHATIEHETNTEANGTHATSSQYEAPQNVHTLILDCAGIDFMDEMGTKTLQQIVVDFDAHDIQVLFAALTSDNCDMLGRAGFIDKYGKEWLFPTIQDAVNHSLLRPKLHPAKFKESEV